MFLKNGCVGDYGRCIDTSILLQLNSSYPFCVVFPYKKNTHTHSITITIDTYTQGPKGGPLEPWSPEIFVVEPGAQSLSLLGARTKMLFLAKWSPGVKQWNPRAPNFPSWSPGVLHFLGRSLGALNPFRTLYTVSYTRQKMSKLSMALQAVLVPKSLP